MRTKDSRINSTNQNPTSIDLRRVLTFGYGFRFFPDVTDNTKDYTSDAERDDDSEEDME